MLEDGENHSEHEHLSHPGLKQVREAHVLDFLAGQCGFDFGNGRVCVGQAPNAGENGARLLRISVFGQPARAFRHQQHSKKKQQRRSGGQSEHPAPALLAEPGIADELVSRAGRELAHEKPVDVLGKQNAQDDGELINRNELAANLSGRDFGDIHRRQIRRQTDGHAAEDAPHDEDREVVGQRVAKGSHRKEQRGHDEQPFAPEFVTERAGDQGSKQTANQRATVRPADLRLARQLEVPLKKRFRPADDHPIPTEQETAHRGDG